MDPVAFTLRHEKRTLDLVTPVRINDARASSNQARPDEFLSFNALWDTGAMASVISKEVVTALGLSPVSDCVNYHTQGQYIARVYLVELLGMDIINLGDFALTHKNDGTVFSFQIPSTHEYDFVKQIQNGVGKKGPKRKG